MNKLWIVVALAALLGLMVLTGCSQALNYLITSKTVDPTGGTINAANGNVTLVVPVGAVSMPTLITVEASADTPPGLVLGTAFIISATGADTLAQPAQLTINYAPANAANYLPSSLKLLRKDTNNGWEEVSGSTVDSANHTATGNITEMGTYAITGQQ